MKKTECKRLGYKYKDILNPILSFIEGFPPARDLLSDYIREKMQELCIGLETGELEIIKFGNEIKELEEDK